MISLGCQGVIYLKDMHGNGRDSTSRIECVTFHVKSIQPTSHEKLHVIACVGSILGPKYGGGAKTLKYQRGQLQFELAWANG